MIKRVFLSLIIALAIGCSNKEKLVQIYFPEDKVTTESGYYINKYGDTVPQGSFAIFDSLGHQFGNGNYKDGHFDGIFTTHNLKGYITEMRNYSKGYLVGSRILYTEYGRLRKYIFYNDKSEAEFIARFDGKGNVKSFEGHPLIDMRYYAGKRWDDLKVGDTLKYKCILAHIYSAKRSIRFENLGTSKKVYRKVTMAKDFNLDVEEKLLEKGDQSIRAIVTYEFDDINKTKIIDSLRLEFTVE